MKIAIVDDEVKWLHYVRNKVISHWKDNISIKTYSSGDEFLNAKEEFQLIFMDIEMSGKDGFTVIKEYKQRGNEGIVIILTIHTEMSRKGYQVGAFRYIDKLSVEEEIEEALSGVDKLLKYNQKLELSLKNMTKIELALNKIIYFETELRKVKVHTEGAEYLIMDSIGELTKRLELKGFYLTHRSYLVNLQWVQCFDKKEVIMKNGDKIILSSRKYKDFEGKYMHWKLQEVKV